MKRLFPLRMTFLLAAALAAGCSDDRGRLAGSGSVTTNGLTGLISLDGNPAEGIEVTLLEENHDPFRDADVARKRTTDAAGRYRFENVAGGAYNLLARHPRENRAVLVRLVAVPPTGDSLIPVSEAKLQATGSIRILLPDFSRELSGYFQLPGTDVYEILDSADLRAGEVVLSGVPASVYPSVMYAAPDADTGRNVLSDVLTVPAGGGGLVMPYALWKRAYKVVINTSAGGSVVGEDLLGFPLLVRLDGGNFDFGAAKPDGSDLRVTKGDSVAALAFEIEWWDAVGRSAAIWVKADTVHALDAGQSLRLFAGFAGPPGNAGAGSPSTAGVFQSGAGFQGVWHLGEIQPGTRFSLFDRATGAFNALAGPVMTPDALTSGVIGKGLLFDGKDDYVELPRSSRFIGPAGTGLTLSAWIRPTAPAVPGDSIRHRLISIKTDSGGISSLAWGISSKGAMAHYSRASDSVYQWPSPLAVDSLYHVALTFEGGRFIGYVNGRQDFTVSGTGLTGAGGQPAMLGAHLPSDRSFQGLVDEVRMESTLRSPEWIRFSFENQRPGSPAVKVEP